MYFKMTTIGNKFICLSFTDVFLLFLVTFGGEKTWNLFFEPFLAYITNSVTLVRWPQIIVGLGFLTCKEQGMQSRVYRLPWPVCMSSVRADHLTTYQVCQQQEAGHLWHYSVYPLLEADLHVGYKQLVHSKTHSMTELGHRASLITSTANRTFRWWL